MKINNYILPIAISATMLAACDSTPSGVLSQSKMEDVLYDYHIAQGMLELKPYTERVEISEAYIDAVMMKHGTTRAEFDSSMVWYARNTRSLHKIYANLDRRLKEENTQAQLATGNNQMMTVFNEGGDTTNIWQGETFMVLRPRDISNRSEFSIVADTTWRKKDKVIFMCKPLFFFQNQSMQPGTSLNVGFTISLKSGKTIGLNRQITMSGMQQLDLQPVDDEEIKEVSGYFYYACGDKASRSIVLINNISLVRMHAKVEDMPADTLQGDTLSTDSLTSDSTRNDSMLQLLNDRKKRRVTLDELHKQQSGNSRHQELRTAPAVRTRNTIGTRKKKRTTK